MEQPILFTAALLSPLLIFFFLTAFLQLPVANLIINSEQNQAGIMLKHNLLVPIYSTGNKNGKYLQFCTAERLDAIYWSVSFRAFYQQERNKVQQRGC